jgi:hypothetical protein
MIISHHILEGIAVLRTAVEVDCLAMIPTLARTASTPILRGAVWGGGRGEARAEARGGGERLRGRATAMAQSSLLYRSAWRARLAIAHSLYSLVQSGIGGLARVGWRCAAQVRCGGAEQVGVAAQHVEQLGRVVVTCVAMAGHSSYFTLQLTTVTSLCNSRRRGIWFFSTVTSLQLTVPRRRELQ